MFSMMIFDSSTSSLLTLLVIKSYKNGKWKIQKISTFRSEKRSNPLFVSGVEFGHVKHLQDLKSFIGQ